MSSQKRKYHFGGYATKANLKCSDGRVIMPDAFKECDGMKVPLVWQHSHNNPNDVLGHAILENRKDGVYAYGVLNEDTKQGSNAAKLVKHGDITALSIHANSLVQKGSNVLHGVIREVSLVLAGANPGAQIDNLSFVHSNGDIVTDDEEAIIHTGLEIDLDVEQTAEEEPIEGGEEDLNHADKTVEEIVDGMTEEQKNVMYALVGAAVDNAGGEDMQQSAEEGGDEELKHNVFDSNNQNGSKPRLSHDDLCKIVADAKKCGSFKEAFFNHMEERKDFIEHAGTYGLDNIDVLFPDAKNVQNEPVLYGRRMGWVPGVLSGVKHSPFARIKSMYADITEDDARAKGYITGTQKIEEVFPLFKRVTTPQTIYKKQKLDRDDIIDITDMDVVAWLKREMRMMLDEEIARAILIGDGRLASASDKIQEANVRPIYTDDDFYSHKLQVPADATINDMIDAVIRARKAYRGSGSPTLYAGTDFVVDALLLKDTLGRRIYNTAAELASVMGVSSIVEIDLLDEQSRVVSGTTYQLLGIMVNLNDYVVGADKGGEINLFDDFDIDFNQYKYLMETRISGALVLPKSAVVLEQAQTATP